MTCAEVLSSLSTASLRDMTADSAVMAHCAACPDCARVTTMLRENEYEAATVLNGLPPMSNPITLAEQSALTSKRRRVGRVAVFITGAALIATIWIAAWTTVIPQLTHADAMNGSVLRTETMQLNCLSPQQAADIINPYVRSRGSTYYIPTSGISAITVRATASELSSARNLIGQFENNPGAACRVSADVKPGIATDPDSYAATRAEIVGAFKAAGMPAPKIAGDNTGAKVPTAPKPDK